MTTKDVCLPFKDKQNVFVNNTVFEDQFRNINLNQNQKCVYQSLLPSKCVTIDKKKVQHYDFTNDNATTVSTKNDYSSLWNKSNKHLASNFLNIDPNFEERDKFKKSKNANNSTLSLHIAAYENSIEATNESNESENDKNLIKKWGTSNQVFGTFIQNPFEFPRQQENEANRPEVMQFTASQTLLNANQMDSNNQFTTPPMSSMHRAAEVESTMQNYDDEDEDMPPPPKELMTPKMLASPVSSRPNMSKISRFTHKLDQTDNHSVVSYDATNIEDETEFRLPELLSPPPNERAIDVPPNYSTPEHRRGVPWKREYRGSHIVTSNTEKRSPDLRHCASTEGCARYTTPIQSLPPPHSGTRLSSQRRLPYTPLSLNPLDSPITPRMSYYNTSGRLQRWSPQRLDLDDSLISYETSNAYVPESDFERFAKRLQTKLATEQNRLRDAKATVQYWRKRDGNQQSWNEICAHALLLLSEIRINTYRDLITRVNTFHHLSHAPPPISMAARSVYTIYRMDINLARDYYLKTAADDPSYVFILVGSTSEKTVASQLTEVSDTAAMRSRRFHIDEEMVFKNLPINFRIHLSLYVMKIDQRARTPKALAKKMAVSLFNKFTPPVPNHNTSIGSRNDEDVTSGFELAGHFVLSRSLIGHFTAFFENALYPLEGTAEVNSKVSALPEEVSSEIKGFWKFLKDTGDLAFYAIMKDGTIQFFEIPQDANQLGDPVFVVDCSTICEERIVPGNPVDAERQYTFSFEAVVFPRGTEISSYKNYVVGYESEEELHKWINAINQVLYVIRRK